MKISIPFLSLFLLLLTFIISVVIVYPYVSLKTYQDQNFSCTTPNNGRCGYKGKSTDRTTTLIVGKLKAKKEREVTLVFPFGKDTLLEQSFILPQQRMMLNTYKNENNIQILDSEPFYPNDMLKMIPLNSTLGVMPVEITKKDIEEARKIILEKKFIQCAEFTNIFIKFLENPNYMNRFIYLYSKLFTQCEPVTSTFTYYEN